MFHQHQLVRSAKIELNIWTMNVVSLLMVRIVLIIIPIQCVSIAIGFVLYKKRYSFLLENKPVRIRNFEDLWARIKWKLRENKCSNKQTHQVWESWRLRGRYSPATDTRTVAAAVMIKDNGNSAPCCERAQQSMKDSSITHPFTTLITPCTLFTNTLFSVALFIRTSGIFV